MWGSRHSCRESFSFCQHAMLRRTVLFTSNQPLGVPLLCDLAFNIMSNAKVLLHARRCFDPTLCKPQIKHPIGPS